MYQRQVADNADRAIVDRRLVVVVDLVVNAAVEFEQARSPTAVELQTT